tara:strand:+ start:11078 stop:11419 length:342 start_codon:yes stop_codon:yes gene_type:complete
MRREAALFSAVSIMARVRNRKPTHPGEVFKLDVMDELGLSVTKVADLLGVSRKHLSAFINGKVPLSTDLAQRIAIATDTSMESWLQMQLELDIWEATQKPRPEMKKVRHLAAA